MAIIRLRTINYLNCKGIVLSPDKPFIEATEEVLGKLSTYIELGYLELIEEEKVNEETFEKIKVDEPIVVNEFFAEMDKKLNGVTTTIKRIHEYSEAELKDMNKAQLLKICEERELEFKKSFSVAKLEELILKNQ